MNFEEDNRIAKDSGVLISICGGVLSIALFSFVSVSPVLADTLMPSSLPAIVSISFNGSIKFLRISLLSAFKGEIYTQ